MKYKIVGQNRDTGARTSMEFEAESKAAAERKAAQAGMSVHHITDVTNGYPGGAPGTNYRGPVKSGGRGGWVKLVILLAVLGVAAWYFWPKLSPLISR